MREIFNHRAQLLHTPPHLGKTRTITSYFSVDPSDRSNKQQIESQGMFDRRVVRPRVSPRPPHLGDRLTLSRPVRSCRTVLQSTHSQSIRGFGPRGIQNRALPARPTSSRLQQTSQQSIQSFFHSALDVKSVKNKGLYTFNLNFKLI